MRKSACERRVRPVDQRASHRGLRDQGLPSGKAQPTPPLAVGERLEIPGRQESCPPLPLLYPWHRAQCSVHNRASKYYHILGKFPHGVFKGGGEKQHLAVPAQKVVPDPNIIKLKREEETLDTIKQYYVLCNNRDEKFQALCNLYGAITIAQAMIFCHTRKTASWLAAELSKEGHQVALLSGEMMVEQRAAVIERFREGKEKVLVTTNVCARGIDVEQVSVVINFDLPVDKDGNPDNETYLHHIGRTGRFGKRGLAVNMVDSKHSMNILNRIQEHFNKKIERLDTDDLDEIEKIAN
ncbi:ATP-dependent RNA helicase DDX19A-like [Choloepus didactylus]|uniref:ATP-dependent RNA helicase DDX19A-like n=1 Tax=Choloepus didactylus TaxID=27675 RepID=UPI00189E4B3F|nr:ATP-dependent RNA helicase DDX19A-like [Choloepus didactylus]